MYIPTYAVKSSVQHEIIALVGAPGCGKTTSAQTFPNRIWGDCDHKLPLNETAIPFYDATFMEILGIKKYQPKDPCNYRDGIRKWLRENMSKFSVEQTFIMDSWTQFIVMASRQISLEDSRLEKPNKFFFYQELKKYCVDVSEYLKSASCRVVTTFHETPEWIDGEATGKMKVVQDGQFKDQLFSIYTDVWRVHNGLRMAKKDAGGMTKTTIIEGRFWQLAGDASFDCNMNSTLSPIVRKHGIKYVQTWIDKENKIQGGYSEIQRILAEDKLVVTDGILQKPL